MIQSIEELVSFLKRFHRRWRQGAETGLSFVPADLPLGLAKIYRELGALLELKPNQENSFRPPFAAQDRLVPLSSLKRIGGMVEFAWENQGNWSCRCALNVSDPPVYSSAAENWDENSSGFGIVCHSLNHFLTTLCLQEAVMSCRHLVAADGDSLKEVLATEASPLWLGGYYVYGEPTHNFYMLDEEEVLIMEYEGIWIGSHEDRLSRVLHSRADVQVIQ